MSRKVETKLSRATQLFPNASNLIIANLGCVESSVILKSEPQRDGTAWMARQISSWNKALNGICEENHASMQKPRSMREIAWWMRFSIPGDALHTKRSCNRSSAAWPWGLLSWGLASLIWFPVTIRGSRMSAAVIRSLFAFVVANSLQIFEISEIFFSKFQLRARKMSWFLQKSFDFPSRDIYLFSLPIISRRTSLVYRESTFRCVLNSGN